jgi:hypothetical protein
MYKDPSGHWLEEMGNFFAGKGYVKTDYEKKNFTIDEVKNQKLLGQFMSDKFSDQKANLTDLGAPKGTHKSTSSMNLNLINKPTINVESSDLPPDLGDNNRKRTLNQLAMPDNRENNRKVDKSIPILPNKIDAIGGGLDMVNSGVSKLFQNALRIDTYKTPDSKNSSEFKVFENHVKDDGTNHWDPIQDEKKAWKLIEKHPDGRDLLNKALNEQGIHKGK